MSIEKSNPSEDGAFVANTDQIGLKHSAEYSSDYQDDDINTEKLKEVRLTDDATRDYLREIGKFELLKAEE